MAKYVASAVIGGVCSLVAAYAWLQGSCRTKSGLAVHAVRLRPKSELKSELLQFAKERKVKAGVIVSCVGSCEGARIRLAAATAETAENEVVMLHGKHEIVSLVGTLGEDGCCHLHVSLADENGKVIGGHLIGDMTVFTTAEIVIGDCLGLCWKREMDPATGFPELVVNNT